jgi:hypothetical protein
MTELLAKLGDVQTIIRDRFLDNGPSAGITKET